METLDIQFVDDTGNDWVNDFLDVMNQPVSQPDTDNDWVSDFLDVMND